MKHMTSTRSEVITTFDINKMQNTSNQYDTNLIHPHGHRLEFIGTNGLKVSLSVAQIATIVAIYDKLGAPGPTTDYLFERLRDRNPQGRQDVLDNF